MAVSISISITQNSQNIANNTSNVTVKVTAKWTGGSHNRLVNASGVPQAKGWLKIDGISYDFASTFNDSETSSGSKVIFTKTVNVTHGTDGKKTLSCSASYATGVSSGTVKAEASKTLSTIARKSTLTVGNGTLGTAQNIKVTRQSTSLTHSIKAKCGTSTVYIKADGSTQSSEVKHTDCDFNFTPPLTWASKNTTGTSVSVTYTITTYSGDTSIGSNSYTKTCSIPASVKPSCSVTVTDATNYSTTYGNYVAGLSKFKVTVTATTAYDSPIASYRTTANGATYTSATFTTGTIDSSGTLTITATVTDRRGRSASASVKKTVLGYASPSISKLTVKRCNNDGSENDRGEYVQVSFNTSVTNIDNKSLNVPAYSLRYKKTGTSTYTDVNLSTYAGQYAVTNGSCIFEADSGSSYDVEFSVSDGIKTTKRATTASTGFTLMHWNALGNGMGIGKISEVPEVLDVGLKTRLLGGLLYPTLASGTNLDAVQTPNTYVGENNIYDSVNSKWNYMCGDNPPPITTGTFTLEVIEMGVSGQVMQRLMSCNKNTGRVFERIYYQSSWSEWVCVSDYAGTLLWSDAYYMTATQTAELSEPVHKQKNGIVLVFSLYDNDKKVAKDQEFFEFFIPKYTVKQHPEQGHNFNLCGMFGNCVKYLYLYNDKIVGHENNSSANMTVGGITYDNRRHVLRYVIGV